MRRVEGETSFAARLSLWDAMMNVHTSNKHHMFNPLITYAHFGDFVYANRPWATYRLRTYH